MAIFKGDCTRIEKEKGTIGGDTYYVWHPKWEGERAICFRPVKNIPVEDKAGRNRHGGLCERAAGWRTDHEGTGACSTHGGKIGRNRAVVNGNNSVQTRKHMVQKIEDYLDDDQNQLMDLSYELAALRVMFKDMIQMFPEPDPDSTEYSIYVSRTIKMIQAAGSLVDKISKIENRNTITINQVLFVRAIMANAFLKFLPDPSIREQAIAYLEANIPTTISEDVVDRPRILVEGG